LEKKKKTPSVAAIHGDGKRRREERGVAYLFTLPCEDGKNNGGVREGGQSDKHGRCQGTRHPGKGTDYGSIRLQIEKRRKKKGAPSARGLKKGGSPRLDYNIFDEQRGKTKSVLLS